MATRVRVRLFSILRERAANIWGSFARKFEPIAQAGRLEPMPAQELARIGEVAA